MESEAGQRSTCIVIVDDHPVVRAALRSLIERQSDLNVVDEANDLAEAQISLVANRPQVLLLDMNLPDGSALDAAPELRRLSPTTEIVLLTADRNSIPGREEAETAGIRSALVKHADSSELFRAIRAAAAGGDGFSSAVPPRESADEIDFPPLSRRQKEVLRLLALGHSGKEIAAQLSLSLRTIETHREHIQQKLGLATRAELTGYALRNRILLPGQ